MKKSIFITGIFLTVTILIMSCGNTNSKKLEKTVVESPKQSLWKENLKNEFIKTNANTDFEKFIIASLISENEFEKDPIKLKEYIISRDFENYINSKSRTYIVNVDNLAGKSKKEIEKIIGKPNSVTKVSPSGTPCPCDKYNYIYDLIEIVFINGKADWITVNNRSQYILFDTGKYQSANRFSDYSYIKVFTK